MNPQKKIKNGQVTGRGIEWTGLTWNPVGGCKHRCRWTMPDGSTAICYAEAVAKKFNKAYPHGFEHHYWRPEKLDEPLKLKEPARIFIDSMSDLGGVWVPEEQVRAVLDICRQAHWHVFQLLTKNAPRLLKFDIPPNVWVMASSPPDSMLGKDLTRNQQERMLHRILETLPRIPVPVYGMSIEPLSWDVAPIIERYPPLKWAIIGAASNGPKVYQPEPARVSRLLEVLDKQGVPTFFKGNLKGNPAAVPWREHFPDLAPVPEETHQLALF